jgi:DNA-binding response OmpR family regulator
MKKRRILIVDDEHSVRKSLQEWFLEDGFDVQTAEDGHQALLTLDSGPFDIYIVDLQPSSSSPPMPRWTPPWRL